MRPTRRLVTAAALVALAAAAPGSVASAASAAPASWSATTAPAFGHDDPVAGPVSDGTRLWTLEVPPRRQALLRSRSIRTGKLLSSVRVAVPRLRGATTLDDPDDTSLPQPQLVIGDRIGAVTGTWCISLEEEHGGGSTCAGARSFYVRFSLRTGRARDGKLTAAPRRLVGGRRPSELVRRPGRTSAIRDLVTRKTVLTVPRTATDVEGAGRFLAWKAGRGPNRTSWATMHVVDRATGRQRYALPARRIMDAVGHKTGENAPWPDVATLTPDGAVDLHVYYGARRVRPVFVDEGGRVRRLGPSAFRFANAFTTRPRGDRVLVTTEINAGDPKEPCVRTSSWLTDRTGRVGNAFRTVPTTGRLRLSHEPFFVSATAVLWSEQTANGDTFPFRYRVVPEAHDLPLTAAGRPAC